MNRRSFFEKVTASMAGAIAAAKLTGRPQEIDPFDLSEYVIDVAPVPESEWGNFATEAVIKDVTVHLDGKAIGIAMEKAIRAGDIVTVALSNMPMTATHVAALKSGGTIKQGDLLTVNRSGCVIPFGSDPATRK